MSDEPPPSLRLKPRMKPEPDSEASSAEAAANPPAKGPEEGGMKIRLRPKLSVDSEAIDPATGLAPSASAHEAEAPPAPDPEPEPEAEPEMEAIQPAAPVAEAPKFRLKTRAGEAASATPAPTPPPTSFAVPSAEDEGKPPAMMQFEPGSEEAAMNIPMPSSPLYVPSVETPATESIRLDLSVPPPPPDAEEEEDTTPPANAPTRRPFKLNIKPGTIGLVAAVIFILGCGAFFVHRVVTQPTTAPMKTKSRIRSIPVPVEPTPIPTPTPTPLPEKEETRARTGSNLVTTSIAPGISATSAGAVEAVNASPAFRSWVAAARISGVFQGATPRALINGRTIRAGQVADEALSITFESIEAESKTIVFKDRTGAEVSRRY